MGRFLTTGLAVTFFSCGFLTGQNIDSFEPYPLVKMNQHVSVVKDSFQQHSPIRVIKGNMYPRKDYADSNLYATIYVHTKEQDLVSIWGTEAHAGISFYRNRIFHINYVLLIADDYKLAGVYNWLVNQLGVPTDSSIDVVHSLPNDYHELPTAEKKFIWQGDHYTVEFLFEKNLLAYQVEIVKVNTRAHEKYLEEIKVVEEQKNQLNAKKSRKVNNLNRITLETLYSMITIVSDCKHYSYLEAILPSYTRTDVVFHKRQHDRNGIYWGYRDMNVKSYYTYHYDIAEKNPVYKKYTCYFNQVVVYCDADHHIFQIRIYFKHDPLVKDIEPNMAKAECTRHYNKKDISGYYDLLQTVIVTLKKNDDPEPKGQSMIISKEFLEYLVDMDE